MNSPKHNLIVVISSVLGLLLAIPGSIIALSALGWIHYSSTENTLPISIFSLTEEMENFSGTSIQRDKIFELYVGYEVITSGYVKNVSNLYDGVMVFIGEENGNNTITCVFNSDWSIARALSVGQKINFSGVVDGYSVGVRLRDCKLVN